MKPNFIILGIAGISQVGKTTTAALLQDALTLDCYTLSRPIKDACAAALGMTTHAFEQLDKDQYLPLLHCTVREFMQTMGDTLIMRNPCALIEHCDTRISANFEKVSYSYNGYIVPDLRTETECNWMRKRGGKVIHVRRHNEPKYPHRTEILPTVHSGDYRINNIHMGTGQLRKSVNALIDELKHNHAPQAV